jgi:hypothetical protein
MSLLIAKKKRLIDLPLANQDLLAEIIFAQAARGNEARASAGVIGALGSPMFVPKSISSRLSPRAEIQ